MQEFLQHLPGGYWLDDGVEDVRRRAAGIHPSDTDLGFLVEEMTRHLERNHVGRTTNLLLLSLFLDEERFLKVLRIKGGLRPSKFDFRGELVQASVTPIVENADRIGVSKSSKRYLLSLLALSVVANGARKLRDKLRESIRDGRTIKSLLVAIDTLFMIEHEAQPGHFPPNAWQHHSKEALAEGFSIALYLFHSSGRHFKDSELGGPVDPETLMSDRYRNLLAECTVFRAYHEWEFEIDSGTHNADIDKDVVLLYPADERAEKATILGFITSEQSQVKAAIKGRPEDAASLAKLAEHLHRAAKESGQLRIVDEPLRRLVFEFPNAPELIDIIKDDKFYAEEVAYLDYSQVSFLVTPEQLTSFVVFGHVTVHDLLKVSRIMNLLRQVLRLEILELLTTEPTTAAQSVLPVFRRDQLVTIFSAVVDKGKSEELLHFWEWTGEGIFDLQYQPIVRAETNYAVPLNVLGDSNVIRNAFQLAHVRIHQQDDPSEGVLANAFEARKLAARHRVGYRYTEQDGEIDVLTVLDGIAFAFECKNSLLPTNPFEFRQTLVYLERANEQLDRLRIFWQEPAFVEVLRQKTGLDLVPGMPLVTCAVTTNRMLSGSLFGTNPVRGLFELASFLHQGGLEILGQKVRVIDGTAVSGADLRAYIESDSLHARMLSAMITHEPSYSVGGVKVIRRTFALNLLHAAKEFGLKVPDNT